jgi:hypothetical protein
VGDHDRGEPLIVPNLLDQLSHRNARERVESASGSLNASTRGRLTSARQRNALLLAA